MGWSGWKEMGGTTGNACATFVAGGKLHLFASGLDNKKIYISSKDQDWSGWKEFGGQSDQPIAAAKHLDDYYFFGKGVDDNKVYYAKSNSVSRASWKSFGGTTDTALSIVEFDGMLYVFAKGMDDDKIYYRKRIPFTGWHDWKEFGGETNAALETVVFKNRLYLFGRGKDNELYHCSKGHGGGWTDWEKIGVKAGSAVSATVFAGDLHLFATGLDDQKLYSMIVGKSNSWSSWFPVPPVNATTDATPAAASFGNTIYLFAKGIDDKKVYGQAMRVYKLPFDGDSSWTSSGNWDEGAHGFGEQLFDYDFSHPEGANIRAVRDGEVVFRANLFKNSLDTNHPDYDASAPGWGTVLHIRHSDGSVAVYMHLKYNSIRSAVVCGATVKKGDILALSGHTGASYNPHLHFGMLSSGQYNPQCTETGVVTGPHIPTYFRDDDDDPCRPGPGDDLSHTDW